MRDLSDNSKIVAVLPASKTKSIITQIENQVITINGVYFNEIIIGDFKGYLTYWRFNAL